MKRCWLVGLLVLTALLASSHAADVVISCGVEDEDCARRAHSVVPKAQSILLQGVLEAGNIPVVRLGKITKAPAPSDWQLTISRVVLVDVQLDPPTGTSSSSSKGPIGPSLWPLNAFSSVGTDLVLQDVRLVVPSPTLFAQYLDFFSQQPVLKSSTNTTIQTDGRTFVHVVNLKYGSTVLQSVTLLSGPCAARFDAAERLSAAALARALSWDNSSSGGSHSSSGGGGGSAHNNDGCNVFTADNSTFAPLLLDQGAISSRESLLVLLQTNATLGKQQRLPTGRIKLGRPLALVGFWGVLTGIDLLMVPNTLDVTAPLARIAFSSLLLENNPTGDINTTLVAAPFSPVATVNVYAVFCSRANASKPCTVLNNVTLVVSSTTEFDYIGYMYTMFNSQAPGAKQLTLFYSQDLLFTALNFTVGPGPDSITVYNATAVSWRMLDVIFTTRPMIFSPLPLPSVTYVDFEAAKAAPLSLQVHNCADLKAALEYRTIPSRFHMVLLRTGLSLAPNRNSSEVSALTPAPTQNATNLIDGPSSINHTEWPAPEPGPTCLGGRAIVAYKTQILGIQTEQQPVYMQAPEVYSNGTLMHSNFVALGFAYTRNALLLPSDQPGQLTFQNLVLTELPQGGTPDELIAAAQLPYLLPPEAWTLLLWSVNSTLTQRALRVRNSALRLPEPEYKHIAALARISKAFVVELAGHPDALTFKDAVEHSPNHLHVGWFEGPGVMGENVTFVIDHDAEAKLSSLSTFWWPADYKPMIDGRSSRELPPKQAPQNVALLPAVLVPIVVALVLAAVAAALLLRRRHKQQLEQLRKDAGMAKPHELSSASDAPFGPPGPDQGNSGSQSNFGSSRRSSRDGGSRTAPVWCAASSSDTSELRVNVDQLMAGDYSHSSNLHHDRMLGPASPSAAAAGGVYHLSSPADHRSARFHGFCPVIEGMPAGDLFQSMSSGGQLVPQLRGARAYPACSSSGSSQGAGHSSRTNELGRPQASSSSSLQSQQQLVSRKSSPITPAGPKAGATTAGVPPLAAAGLADTVASGLEKWRSVVSSTTMQLAERRLAGQQANAISMGGLQASSASTASASSDCVCQELVAATPPRQRRAAAAAAAGQAGPKQDDAAPDRSPLSSALVLKRVLGQGSFGQVWLGLWRGIAVAVKIMHLPTSVLLDQQDQQQHGDQEGQHQSDRVMPPHFAVMEAVLSSQCCHPNVVQVYTYMLTPLLSHDSSNYPAADDSTTGPHVTQVATVVGEPGQGSKAADVAAEAAAAAVAAATSGGATLSGWELKLVLELADAGTLRTALDKGMLKQPGAAFMDHRLALLLARDVAAAMLHLHSEGVVHGDLKAANVMLATGGADPEGIWTITIGRRLVAKVADFGLAVSLGPSETHASLTARGTPSHMSPELFMSGRVSKACDSYAFGMLLFEIATGQRAFPGVPLPLLPHEVAVKGLRPEWPDKLPAAFAPIRQLAEACWLQEPDQRPVFAEVLDALDHWVEGQLSYRPSWLGPQQPGQQQQQLDQQDMQQQHQQQQPLAPEQEQPQQVSLSPAQQQQQHLQPGQPPPLQPQQQQQHRQWRHTVCHADTALSDNSSVGPLPAASIVPQGAASAAAAGSAAAQPRGGMEWSEVSFDVLNKAAPPGRS